jgi:hypothetical protein
MLEGILSKHGQRQRELPSMHHVIEHRGFDIMSAYNDNALLIAVSCQPVSVRIDSYGH